MPGGRLPLSTEGSVCEASSRPRTGWLPTAQVADITTAVLLAGIHVWGPVLLGGLSGLLGCPPTSAKQIMLICRSAMNSETLRCAFATVQSKHGSNTIQAASLCKVNFPSATAPWWTMTCCCT